MRYSKQREEILNIVRNSFDHLDAGSIYLKVKKLIPNISLGTVYRNLNYLVEQNFIRKISIKDSNDVFDKTITSHNHICCVKCGKVIDICSKISSNELSKIEQDTAFKITDSNFNIKGICSTCIKERKN